MLDYDYLVVALGATVNTFNTPGVMENCYFLKVNSYNINTLHTCLGFVYESKLQNILYNFSVTY
jgi:NADH dehydrogenase FAD-containing subunit